MNMKVDVFIRSGEDFKLCAFYKHYCVLFCCHHQHFRFSPFFSFTALNTLYKEEKYAYVSLSLPFIPFLFPWESKSGSGTNLGNPSTRGRSQQTSGRGAVAKVKRTLAPLVTVTGANLDVDLHKIIRRTPPLTFDKLMAFFPKKPLSSRQLIAEF